MPAITDARDKAISIVKSKGPILPYQIAKEIHSDLIIASAYLSELASKGIVKISNIKVGGSPLYYAPGQEPKLQNFSSNLGEKERKAYDLLKEKKVLEETSLTPVIRVALRDIKDFAVPLNVSQNSKIFVFWKWYLLSNKEAEPIINGILNSIVEQKIQQLQPTQQPIEQKPIEQTLQKQEKKPETQTEIKQPQKGEAKDKSDILYNTTIKFFSRNEINVKNFEIIKKNSEIDFVIEVPSAFGNLTYLCKTKDKKKVSHTDLNNAFVEGQMKKLPVMFLSTGELSKKAEELLKRELKGLKFVNLK